jgi:phosphoglycolate phosphatase-like HAD superfamily hydrolase
MKIFLSICIAALFIAGCNKNEKDAKVYLSSWSDNSKSHIETWVKKVTDSSSASYIPVSDRIAVFDNDGTLWAEHPIYTQFFFAIDELKAMASKHPEIAKNAILNAVLKNNLEPLKAAGTSGLLNLINTTHTNIAEGAFRNAVTQWMDTAKDVRFHKSYKQLAYQPMIELLEYLRANGFKTFIVSGGGGDFMRAFSEEIYGIPTYQVIGSYGDATFEIIDGKPVITKIAAAPFIDDNIGKPIGIHRFIGKVPVFCAGNSDGDQAMLEYTTSSKYKSFCMIVHHTDSIREYNYDSATDIGHLQKALIEADEKKWMVVDMKNDFKKIFSFQ